MGSWCTGTWRWNNETLHQSSGECSIRYCKIPRGSKCLLRRKSECDAPNSMQASSQCSSTDALSAPSQSDPLGFDILKRSLVWLCRSVMTWIAPLCQHAGHRFSSVYVMILRCRNFGMWLISYSGVRDLLPPAFPANFPRFQRARRLQTCSKHV